MFLDLLLFSSIVLGWVLYWTTCLLRGYPAKISTMTLQWFTISKQYRVPLEPHITKGQLQSTEETSTAQLSVMRRSDRNFNISQVNHGHFLTLCARRVGNLTFACVGWGKCFFRAPKSLTYVKPWPNETQVIASRRKFSLAKTCVHLR